MYGNEYDAAATPEQQDEYDEQEQAPDPFTVEPLLLPSGGKVTFRSLATVTGEDLRWIRDIGEESNLKIYNEMTRRAMVKLVESWDLTTATGRPVPLPREKNSPYAKMVSAFDLGAIERHLQGPISRLINDADESEGE